MSTLRHRLDAVPYERRVLWVFVLVIFMTVIDGTMVNVALPRMADDFGVEPVDVEWIAVAYLLALASVIPAAGWLGDRFGTRRVFLVGLVAFVVASFACGVAATLDQLVALRVAQGLAGGVLTPIGSAILFRAYPPNQRATAAAAVLSVAVVAPALGPLLGGLLVDQASWRWIFLVNIPIGALGVALSAWALRRDDAGAAGRFDAAGLVLSAGSITALLYAMSVGPERGWTSPLVLGLAGAGVAALVGAIVVELRVPEPMLALRLFRDRLFRSVNTAAALIYAGFFGQIYILPIYLQTLRGHRAFESGLVQAPQAVGVLLVSNLVGARAYQAVGPRRLMTVGTAIAAAITCSFGLLSLTTPLWLIGGGMFLRGCAMALVFLAIQTAVYGSISHADMTRATSLFNTQRQFAYASGVALCATVLAAGLAGTAESATASERLGAHRWSFLAVGLVMIPAIALAWRVRDEDAAATRSGGGPVVAAGGRAASS